jgi:hypothetical protein
MARLCDLAPNVSTDDGLLADVRGRQAVKKQPDLPPRQRQILEVLKAAGGGLDKYQVASKLDISSYMADIYLHLLCELEIAVLQGNRYYINDAGIALLAQPMLPGMETTT